MLTINNLQVTFGKTKALNITKEIHFEPGDHIGIIGSNGAGKSTLIQAILGLLPYQGTIRSKVDPQKMSVHLQENMYVNTVSVKMILETILGTSLKKNPKLQELVSFLDFDKCLSKKFKQLSGGQQQRLTIILVLMQDSELTFFDEVTSGLDFETRQQLMGKISQWYENKTATIAIISHYYEELQQLANKILILEKGEVVAFGKADELFKKYCGYSTVTINMEDYDKLIMENFQQLQSPKHLVAFSCKNHQQEIELASHLIQKNINFKRSNNDIEIMTINAKYQEGFNYETK